MARLPQGVRERKNGGYEKRFTASDGKRHSVYGQTVKELAAKEIEMRQQIEAGLFQNKRHVKLSEYFEEVIERKKDNVKGNTLCTYRNVFRKHIEPFLGGVKVCEIERRQIVDLQKAIKKTHSVTTVNYVINILGIILNEAVRDDILLKNPANIPAIKTDTKRASKTYHRALTIEEQAAFMEEMKSDYYYTFVAMLLLTGLRHGECAALTWQDIDQKANCIHINKTLSYDENGKMIVGDSPKTIAGVRDIPLNDDIKAILKMQRDKMNGIYPIGCKLVFVSVYGNMITNPTINLAIKKAIDRMQAKGYDIPHFTCHSLRHTFATRAYENGVDFQTLKGIAINNSIPIPLEIGAEVTAFFFL